MTLKSESLLNKKVMIISVLFLVALGVRLIALKQNYVIARDGMFYITMAQRYSAEDYDHELVRNHQHYAFFPLLIVGFHKILADWILAGQLLSVVFGAATVVPLYLLARKIFDERVALLAAVFYIISPNLVRYSAEVLRDTPAIFFYTTALWLGYKGIKDRKSFTVCLAGVFIVLAASVRIEGLALFASLSIFLFGYGLGNEFLWKTRLKVFGALLVAVFGTLVAFGMLTNTKGVNISKRQFASAMSALPSVNQGIENLEEEIEEEDISAEGRSFLHLARTHRFAIYLSHIVYKTVKLFNIFFLLFLFGLIKRREIRYRPNEFLLFSIYAVFVPVFLIYLSVSNYLSTRHPLPLVVPSLIWSGVGFVELKERVIRWVKDRDFPVRALAPRWIAPLLLIVVCVPLLSKAWAPNRKDILELKHIGLWLKDHGHANSVFLGQHEFARLVFYAEGEFILLPRGSYEDVMRFAGKNGADFLVVNQKTINRLSPGFLELLSPKELQRIQIHGIKTPKYSTLVFQIKKDEGRE